jgi:hypothetical protein
LNKVPANELQARTRERYRNLSDWWKGVGAIL